MAKVDYSSAYWVLRTALVKTLNKEKGTPQNHYALNKDGSVSQKYLRPTKGWKTFRLLLPNDWKVY